MKISDMQASALAVREKFSRFEQATYGRQWSTTDLVNGFITDVGDLSAAIQRMEGIRPPSNEEPIEELKHEISDCIWVLLVIADRYKINVGESFEETMHELDAWLDSNMAAG